MGTMTDEQLKELNQSISGALENWSNITLIADADNISYKLDFTKSDLLNALIIFNHVAQNVGIKNGTLNFSNVSSFGQQMREIVKKFTGHDPRDIVNDQYSKKRNPL